MSLATRWSCSRASLDRASRRWRSGRFTPRRNAATWSRSRRTRAGCFTRWPCPRSTPSTACRRRWRCSSSAGRPPRGHPSAASRRCRTCCVCCTRAPAPTRAARRTWRPRPSRRRRLRARRAPYADGTATDLAQLRERHPEKAVVTRRIAEDAVARLKTLIDLGLGYLSLDRSTPTLSPGELQRQRLGTQVRANLFGVAYVLDEPSAGLHPQDTETLLAALDQLKRA